MRWKGLAWTALCLLPFAAAVAQDTGDTGVLSELERVAATSDDEKVAYAEAANTEIADAVRQIARLLETVRRGGDGDEIQCVTSKLTTVRALQQVSQASTTAMNDAIASAEPEKADHNFRKVAVARSKARGLVGEAQRCSADQAGGQGDSLTEMDGAQVGDTQDSITDEDYTEIPPESPYF
jgi:hypothetical protein